MATAAINVPMVLIAPPELIYPLLASPFLTPSSTWHLLTSRAKALGCTEYVKPFFAWMRFYMRPPVWAIIGLKIIDLSDTTLRKYQAVVDQLIPKHLPTRPPHYLPPVPLVPTPMAYPLLKRNASQQGP